MTVQKLALLSVHTSPLAPLGGKKTGGMNVYVKEFAQELGRRGIAVDIYTRQSAPTMPEIDYSLGENVRVIHITAGPQQALNPEDLYPYLSQFAAHVIAFTTRENLGYDIIYSHYYLSGWVANKLNEVWGIPFVQMFHTLGHMKNRIIPGAASLLVPDQRITLETQVTHWADRIIAATPAEQSQLLWLYRMDRRKIVIVPPGVNPARFHPMNTITARHRIGLPEGKNLLLFVGRIEPLKGVDTILESLHLIRRNNPALLENTRFAIIGGDPANRELKQLKEVTTGLGLSDVVDLLGARDQTALPYYYAAATALLMPSDYESFGMVALEAMSTGTPVIASETGGLAFLVRDGETGFLVPVRDPAALAGRITTLLTQPDLRNKMSQAASRLAQQYTWSAIADRLIQVFEDILSRPQAVNHHKH